MPRLRVLEGPMGGTVFELEPEGNKLGRDRANHAVLADPSVAPRHARLWCQDGAWMLEPVSSQAYTFVNDRPVAPGTTARVAVGDTLWLGDVALAFEETPGAPDDGAETLAEATAALEAAERALAQQSAEIALLQNRLGRAEEGCRMRDDYLRQRDEKIKALQKDLTRAIDQVSRQLIEAEVERIRRQIEAEARKSIEAAQRRMLEMESRYVGVQAQLEASERRQRELEDQVHALEARLGM